VVELSRRATIAGALIGVGQLGPTAQARAASAVSTVNALDFGVKADGITNDAPAWNALVSRLEGTGSTVTWSGRSLLRGQISWKQGVSLVGQGTRSSALIKSTSHSPTAYFSAIGWAPGYSSFDSPFADLVFADFEIDGSGVVGTGPAIHDKAIFMQHLLRCEFRNLNLHDTVGTALGVDFLRDCVIRGVHVSNSGRGWDGVQGGHAGIGIGQGMAPTENLLIEDCVAIGCGHWGIFVERQHDAPYSSDGASIRRCFVESTRGSGLGDYGCTRTVFRENISINNGLMGIAAYRDGITVTQGAHGSRVIGNTCNENRGDGISIHPSSVGSFAVVRNSTKGNTNTGIAARSGDSPLTVLGALNLVEFNGAGGITYSGHHMRSALVRNDVRSNSGDGINLSGFFDDLSIKGNVIGNRVPSDHQKYGVRFEGPRRGRIRVAGNSFRRNARGAVAFNGEIERRIKFGHNRGAKFEAHGNGVMETSDGQLLVRHGLDGTPTYVLVSDTQGTSLPLGRVNGKWFQVERPTARDSRISLTWRAGMGQRPHG
jgi:parallel beta-helix repeat protein